jgi:hypothetical protein
MCWLVWCKKPKITHLKPYQTTLEHYFIPKTPLRLTSKWPRRQQKKPEKFGPILLQKLVFSLSWSFHPSPIAFKPNPSALLGVVAKQGTWACVERHGLGNKTQAYQWN